MDDLDRARRYSELVKQEWSLRKQLDQLDPNSQKFSEIFLKYDQTKKELNDLTEYIKTYGKNSPTLSSLFFDPNLVDWFGEDGKKILKHNLWIPEDKQKGAWYNPVHGID